MSARETTELQSSPHDAGDDSVAMHRSCPLCQYDWRDLPQVHKCPECGLDYDPQLTVYRLRPHAGPVFLISAILVGCFTAYFFARQSWDWPSILICLTACISVTVVFLRFRLSKNYVIFDRRGISTHGHSVKEMMVRWTDFASVQQGLINGDLVFKDIDGNVIKILRSGSLGGAGPVREVIAIIEERKRL